MGREVWKRETLCPSEEGRRKREASPPPGLLPRGAAGASARPRRAGVPARRPPRPGAWHPDSALGRRAPPAGPGAHVPRPRTPHRCGEGAAGGPALSPARGPRGHCLRTSAAGGFWKPRGPALPRSAPTPAPPPRHPRRPSAAGPHRTYLRRRLRDAVLARGLAASGGGGASGPSDHLWKRRGGGCLLVQLQPTNGSYFGVPAAPRLQPNSPPRGLGAGPLAGAPGGGAHGGRATAAPPGRLPRSRWSASPTSTRGRRLSSPGAVSQAHVLPSIFSLGKPCKS